ncbi:MAG: hypothetical protein P8144_05475 [Gammaproteobacteria bacterium]
MKKINKHQQREYAAPLTPEQLMAFQKAVVAHCVDTVACLRHDADPVVSDDTVSNDTVSNDTVSNDTVSNDTGHRLLSEAARAGVRYLRGRALRDFVPADELIPWVEKALQRPELLEPLGHWFGQTWRHWVSDLQTTRVPVAQGMDKAAFQQAFVWFVDDEARKARWIHALVHNAEYRNMITGVVFEMIRQFFQDEALLAKLPGLGHVLKMSKWGVGKMLPQWEQLVEDVAKSFINKNLALALKLSENFLLDSLSSERVFALSAHLWSTLEARPPSQVVNLVDVLGEPALKGWTASQWRALVEGPFWSELIQPLVANGVQALCAISCGELWNALDVPEAQWVAWHERLWGGVISELAENPEFKSCIESVLAPCFTIEFLQDALS